jgi:hypothetical protein
VFSTNLLGLRFKRIHKRFLNRFCANFLAKFAHFHGRNVNEVKLVTPKWRCLPNSSITPLLQSGLAAAQAHNFCAQRKNSLRNLGRNAKTVAGSFAACKRSINLLRYIKAHSAAACKGSRYKVSLPWGREQHSPNSYGYIRQPFLTCTLTLDGSTARLQEVSLNPFYADGSNP